MKLTKLTSAILLGATLLTGTVACSKQDNSTAQTSQTTSHKSTAAKSSDNSQSSQTSDSSTETTNSVKTEISKIKLSQQEAIDKSIAMEEKAALTNQEELTEDKIKDSVKKLELVKPVNNYENAGSVSVVQVLAFIIGVSIILTAITLYLIG